MNREQIVEILKQYLAYKHAVTMYERHRPIPAAGIANYSGMQGGSGAPERFFALVGKPADMGNTSREDYYDYQVYKEAVTELEGAFSVLTEEEYSIIKLKWMQDVTLKQIADRKSYSIDTVKRNHKSGMKKLSNALRFVQLPEIIVHGYAKVDSF